MGVVRHYIARRLGRLDRDDGEILRTVPLGDIMDDQSMPPRLRLTARRLIREGDREIKPSKRKEFEMLFSAEHTRLLRHLRLTSRRPMIAAELFSLCMREMEWNTREVKLSRFAIAKELGVKPDVVSQLMGELVKCGAMRRSFEDDDGNRVRAVRYFVSARIAHRGESSAALDNDRAKEPVLKLVGGTDLPTERRSRAPRCEAPVL